MAPQPTYLPPLNAHPPLWGPMHHTNVLIYHLAQTRSGLLTPKSPYLHKMTWGRTRGSPLLRQPLCWINQHMGTRKKRYLAQEGTLPPLEAEPRAGSPVFFGNQDSQARGHSSTEEAVEPQTCCPDPHPHPRDGGQVLLLCSFAAMTPSLPSH